MKVYILYRKFWHFVDGESEELINVYAKLDVAQERRDQMQLTGACEDETSSVWFEIEEEFVL